MYSQYFKNNLFINYFRFGHYIIRTLFSIKFLIQLCTTINYKSNYDFLKILCFNSFGFVNDSNKFLGVWLLGLAGDFIIF